MGHRGFGADENYHAVTGEFQRATEAAILFEPENLGESVWIPRSTIRGTDEKTLDDVARGETITIHIMEWILKKHGIV